MVSLVYSGDLKNARSLPQSAESDFHGFPGSNQPTTWMQQYSQEGTLDDPKNDVFLMSCKIQFAKKVSFCWAEAVGALLEVIQEALTGDVIYCRL